MGVTAQLLEAGAIIKPSFCGPCFGAGDVPANNGLSLRHTTRNFPNREGSKPGEGQFAGVCLMDARSIAATAHNGGTHHARDATWTTMPEPPPVSSSTSASMHNRVYYGFGQAEPGDCSSSWARTSPTGRRCTRSTKTCCSSCAAVIHDPVTTTDELIPSGETSSYRSNPLRLAEFTLSRRVPDYVRRSKGDRRAGSRTARGLMLLPRRCDAVLAARRRRRRAAEDDAVRLLRVRQQARRRLCPRAGGLVPEGAGRLREHLLRICHQALPQQLHQLGHAAVHAGCGYAV